MVWYSMVCFAILCYGMVWKVWYDMRFQCYAMVYVVKDKHSATVFQIQLKTFITSISCVILSEAQIPSKENSSEYDYKKSFITSGPG